MALLGDIMRGAGYALQGWRLIRYQGIRRYIVIPLGINIVLFIALIAFLQALVADGIAGVTAWLPSWLDWLSGLLWLLFVLSMLLFVFYSFTLVANFIAAPFNGLLAKKLEQQLTTVIPQATENKTTLLQAIKDTLGTESLKIVYLLSRVIPLIITSLIPGINLLAPPLWLFFGIWMLTLEYMDYPMGNHGVEFKQQRQKLWQKLPVVLGFGSVITLMTLIPLVNFIAMPVAVTGATLFYTREFGQQRV